jgi:hypothetical protein
MVNSYEKCFFENVIRLIIRDFWMVKFWSYFHKSTWVAISIFFPISLSQKHMFSKGLHGALFIRFLWVFLLELSN